MTLVDRSELHRRCARRRNPGGRPRERCCNTRRQGLSSIVNSSGGALLGHGSPQSCTPFGLLASVSGIPVGTFVTFSPYFSLFVPLHQSGELHAPSTARLPSLVVLCLQALPLGMGSRGLCIIGLLPSSWLDFGRYLAFHIVKFVLTPGRLATEGRCRTSLVALARRSSDAFHFVCPCAVTVRGVPGHNWWRVAETPLPATSQGRNMDCLFYVQRVSLWCRVLFNFSRRGGQSPRYREHAQGADAVSTGPQQARRPVGPGARQQSDPTVSLECAHDPPVSSGQPPQATPGLAGDHPEKMAGTNPTTGRLRIFSLPPVDAGGVAGNITLFHQYMAYISSGSLRMRCRRGYAGVTFSFNRHNHDRSGCFFPFGSRLRSGPDVTPRAGDSQVPGNASACGFSER